METVYSHDDFLQRILDCAKSLRHVCRVCYGHLMINDSELADLEVMAVLLKAVAYIKTFKINTRDMPVMNWLLKISDKIVIKQDTERMEPRAKLACKWMRPLIFCVQTDNDRGLLDAVKNLFDTIYYGYGPLCKAALHQGRRKPSGKSSVGSESFALTASNAERISYEIIGNERIGFIQRLYFLRNIQHRLTNICAKHQHNSWIVLIVQVTAMIHYLEDDWSSWGCVWENEPFYMPFADVVSHSGEQTLTAKTLLNTLYDDLAIISSCISNPENMKQGIKVLEKAINYLADSLNSILTTSTASMPFLEDNWEQFEGEPPAEWESLDL